MSSRSPCRTRRGARSPPHLADARERREQHDSRGRALEREIQRHGAAQRLAEVQDALGFHAGLFQHASQRRAGVTVGALLARPAGTAAVAAIVEEQHVESSGRQHGGVGEAVADVAAVAVAQQQMAERVGAGADPPPVQPLAVGGLEPHVAVVQPRPARRLDDRPRGEVEQRVEQRADHRTWPSSAARARRASRRARRMGWGVRARRLAARTADTAVSRSVRHPGWTTRGRAPTRVRSWRATSTP